MRSRSFFFIFFYFFDFAEAAALSRVLSFPAARGAGCPCSPRPSALGVSEASAAGLSCRAEERRERNLCFVLRLFRLPLFPSPLLPPFSFSGAFSRHPVRDHGDPWRPASNQGENEAGGKEEGKKRSERKDLFLFRLTFVDDAERPAADDGPDLDGVRRPSRPDVPPQPQVRGRGGRHGDPRRGRAAAAAAAGRGPDACSRERRRRASSSSSAAAAAGGRRPVE